MFGLTKKKGSEPVAEESTPQLFELERRIRAVELGLDDLGDQLRRFRARAWKRMAVDEAEAAASAAAGNGRPMTISELKAAGRWPLR